MEQEERNALGVIAVVIGICLLIFTGASLMTMSWNLFFYILTPFFYIYLDLVILAIILFLYAYFLIKPAKTIQGKKNLGLGAMFCGGILVFFAVVAISLNIYHLSLYGAEFFYVVLLIPGVALLVHGWHLERSTASV